MLNQLENASRNFLSTITIYWDRAENPTLAGPAYRDSEDGSSGPLEFFEWGKEGMELSFFGMDNDAPGYKIEDYFDSDGKYLGPDSEGIYPRFHF